MSDTIDYVKEHSKGFKILTVIAVGVVFGSGFVISHPFVVPVQAVIGGIAFAEIVYRIWTEPDTEVETETIYETDERVVPFDEWPEQCHSCGENLGDNETRSLYAIHRGENARDVKAVGCCEECTWSVATIIDNVDLQAMFDFRGDPEEL